MSRKDNSVYKMNGRQYWLSCEIRTIVIQAVNDATTKARISSTELYMFSTNMTIEQVTTNWVRVSVYL